MTTSLVVEPQRVARNGSDASDERMHDRSGGLLRHRRGVGGVAEVDPTKAPLPSSGRSVVAAVALVFCSLTPAWATDEAEFPPPDIPADVRVRVTSPQPAPERISAEEFCWLTPAWATDEAEYSPGKLLADVRACLRRAGTFSPHAPRRTLAEEAVDTGLISSEEAFELWNDCQPIAFSVHLQGKNEASKIGLTKEAIETAVRSRLRSARIFKDDPDRRRSISLPPKVNGFLQVSVTLTAVSLDMSMGFEKVMTDEASRYVGWTPTGWWRGLLGEHVDDGYYFLSGIAPVIDEFIDDYLRVNESACSR